MQALTYLFFTKMKGTVRNIFSNAVSGIITFISIIFVLFLTFMIFTMKEELGETVSVTDVHALIMMYLGAMFFFSAILFLQKRTALVYKADANYIFSGPFSRKTVLNYLLVDSVKGSILYALFAVFYLCMMAGYLPAVTPGFVGIAFIVSTVLLFVMLGGLTYLYLLEITNPNAKKIKIGVIVVIAVLVIGLFAKNFLECPNDIQLAVANFLEDPLFYFVPLFGYTKLCLVGFVEKNVMMFVGGLALDIFIAVVLWLLIVNVRGDFYEKVMEDAEWADEIRKQAQLGKTKEDMNKKIKEVKNVEFRSGAAAIASKNILELRKTKNWLRKQEAFLMLFYLAIAFMIDMGYTFFQYYILIILLMSANTDFIVQELKHHYIYLIPDKPFKKIMYLIQPMMIKMVIMVLFGLTAGLIVFRPSIIEYLASIANILSYGIMFIAGSIWSIRLLKSGNNAFAEQMIKMLVMLAACIPAVVASVAVILLVDPNMSYDTLMSIVSVVSVICNGLVGLLFIIFAKGMLNGANVMAD
ncbi:MAG: putative ABC exporter domain-containing protein [Erysipelotrichales bacterium]|nr:putative ABC exporter domain-containing protein [Erysipelotrichales bacterium]